MTRTIGEPTLTGEIARRFKELLDRVKQLEERNARGRRNLVIVIGPMKSSDVYGPDWIHTGGTILGGELRAGTAGSSSSTVLVKRNGSTVTDGTITLTSSATGIQHNMATPAPFKPSDSLTIDATLGTGADDLVLQLYVRVPG